MRGVFCSVNLRASFAMIDIEYVVALLFNTGKAQNITSDGICGAASTRGRLAHPGLLVSELHLPVFRGVKIVRLGRKRATAT